MPDYSKGKIYRLVGSGMTYYGSTVKTLNERKSKHRSAYKQFLIGKKTHVTSFDIIKEECIIELVENYPCLTKKELETRERYYIENNECINRYVPTQTRIEWRLKTKEQKKQYDAEYREKNAELLKQKKQEYYLKNIEHVNQKSKQYHATNAEYLNQKHKEYVIKHSDNIKKYKNMWHQNKKARTIVSSVLDAIITKIIDGV